MNTVEGAECYVIHSKPFRDTSVIVELLSRDYGRVSVIFKGVKNAKGVAKSRILQPFQPLLVSWSGARELKKGRDVEQSGVPYLLTGKRLFSGIYVNELLMRLLYRDAPAEGIIECYENCLVSLKNIDNVEFALRQFEFNLLDAVGYQLPCDTDIYTGEPIDIASYYRYNPNQGFSHEPLLNTAQSKQSSLVFAGDLLQALAIGDLQERHLRDAKRLMRAALAPHIGAKPLESKKLFIGASRR